MKIALYIDEGIGYVTINHWVDLAKRKIIPPFDFIKAPGFKREVLDTYDWIIFPGGSGSGICSKLQDKKDILKDAIRDGLNVIGICAGAYAFSNGYSWSLGLINYDVADIKNAHRGTGYPTLKFNKESKKTLKLKKLKDEVYYHNGPVLHPTPNRVSDISNESIISIFESDVCENKGIPDLMIGTPAIMINNFGIGRVVTVSPHIEKTDSMAHIVKRFLLGYQ